MTVQFILAKPYKSYWLAVLLTVVFGPVGLFYASVAGGLIMTFLGPMILAIFFLLGVVQKSPLILGLSIGFFLFFAATYWLIAIIWSIIGVDQYNRRINIEYDKQFNLFNRLEENEKNQVIVNINQNAAETLQSNPAKSDEKVKPALQEWLKSNPGKSINEYFSKFGR